MAVNHVYQILFFLQSAACFLFILNFSQNCDIIHKPADVVGAHVAASATTARGRLSNCTLQDVTKRPGVVMLTTTNFAFSDMALNMLESIKRTGVCVNTTVIAEDQKVYKYLYEKAKDDPAVHVVNTSSGGTDSTEVKLKGAKAYYIFLKRRQRHLLALLERGFEVLFTDTDTFWFRDPFPYFQGDFDVSMIDTRSPFPNRTADANFCCGFAYFKPTNVTLQFVKTWVQVLKRKLILDQVVMNRLLKADEPVRVNVRPLDTNIFPFGPKFYRLLAAKANYSIVVMHAAGIRGHAAKVAKFQSSKMWLINVTNDDELT